MSHPPVFAITPTVQQYDWGKLGLDSKVAQFAKAVGVVAAVDSSKPYAELWMGTHPSSPSLVADGGQPLADVLAAQPALLGAPVTHTFADDGAARGNLPFLFKVLAIAKALSIQSHPDKKTAARLHAEKPSIYKDPNHKPEMALALTPFTALCGFRPLPEIAHFLLATPELASLVPRQTIETFTSVADSSEVDDKKAKAALKDVFAAVVGAPEDAFKPALETLVKRYDAGGAAGVEQGVRELVLQLHAQFPGDVGVLCAFLLNEVKLQPGEAIFLGAGEPHAYVSGDIMECMANSDNVIRAGLTPKLRDVPNLVQTLTYAAAPATAHTVSPAPFDGAPRTTLYAPPVREFAVLRTDLEGGGGELRRETHRPLGGPSVAIVTEGKATIAWGGEGGGMTEGTIEVPLGGVVFVGAGTRLEITSAAAESTTVLFRAFVEV